MTGFGVGDAPLGDGRVVAEIRSVNQRFLDVRARLPKEMSDLSLFAEQVVRERLRRGRVELLVRTEGPAAPGPVLDKTRARAAFRALAELRDEIAPGAELPMSLLAAVPELFAAPDAAELGALRSAVRLSIERAAGAMLAMADREGGATSEDLAMRCEALRGLVREAGARTLGARARAKERLEERLASLFARGTPGGLDPVRLESEVVLLVERSDVSEEIARLGSHLEQFSGLLSPQGTEPLGRRLDFLLQEMLREANTLGSKAQDAEASQLVVAMKLELERMREQVQNVE